MMNEIIYNDTITLEGIYNYVGSSNQTLTIKPANNNQIKLYSSYDEEMATVSTLSELNDFITNLLADKYAWRNTWRIQKKSFYTPNDILYNTIIDANANKTKPNTEGDSQSMEDIYNYMYWGDYNLRMKELSEMALDEPWSFTTNDDYAILKNYLKYTFWKLRKEGKVIENENYCLFNTGLFTSYYEPIYAYGEASLEDTSSWRFKGFMTEYDLGAIGISEYPERADYFSDPSLLVFDWHCKINVQYRHILEDEENRERLPESLLNSDSPLEMLKGVIDTAIKRVMANYKLAVPHYFRNQIQLMIPLCFGKTDEPDLALVLSKMPGGYYQAHTCLSMEMAYLDARLIAKPESNWLSL